MNYESNIAILNKLLSATVAKRIVWTVDASDEWYTTVVGGREICFRFLYYEATNQIGADRRMIEFNMPGRDGVFACGTIGFDILLDILAHAFAWEVDTTFDPMKFLIESLPD